MADVPQEPLTLEVLPFFFKWADLSRPRRVSLIFARFIPYSAWSLDGGFIIYYKIVSL
jgi:hypothetical protein